MALEEALARYFAVLSQSDQHRDSIAAALDGREAESCADSAAYFLGRMQSLCTDNEPARLLMLIGSSGK